MWAELVSRMSTGLSSAVEEIMAIVSRKTRLFILKLMTASLGAGIIFIGLLAFTASLFFKLAELSALAFPALYTGIIVLVTGVAMVVIITNRL